MKTFKFISMGNALFVRAFLLTVIMIIGGGNIAWGDTILKTIDFSDESWLGMEFNQGNTTTADFNEANDVTFYSQNPTNQFSLSGGVLTFPDTNMSSDNYALGFPVTGIVGGIIIIKVYNGSLASQIKYAINDGGTTFSTSDLSSGTSAPTYGTPCTVIKTGLSDTKAYIYIGRHSTSYKTITKIEVYTVGLTDLSESSFYNFYKTGYASPANLISGASLDSYIFTDIGSRDNSDSNSSSVTSPHDFSAISSESYSRLKASNTNTIAIGGLSHVKSIRLYGNGSGVDGTINVNVIKISGTGTAMTVSSIDYANSNQTVLEYSTGDLSLLDGYDIDTYYFYTITFAKKSSSSTNFSLWGLYIEYNAAISHTVSYAPNGGTGTISNSIGTSITLSDGTGFTAPSGYTFAGWNTDEHGTGTSYMSGQENVTADLALYAVWTQNGTIDDNGGTADGAYTATYNKAGIQITTAPTNGSYAINGYYKADTGDDLVASSAGALEASTTYTDASSYWTHTGSAPTLYAQWDKTHELTVEVNDADMGSAEAEKTIIAEGSTTTVTATPETGYKFRSWAVSGTGAKLSSTTTNPTTLTMGTADATVTATFSALETYTITYNAGSAEGITGSKASETKTEDAAFTLPSSAVFTRSGYLQTGWATSDGGDKAYELGGTYTGNADLDLYPYWIEQHTITYNNNGGWGMMTATTGAGTVTLQGNSCSKTGYSFLGWATSQDKANAGDVEYADKDEYTLDADVTLYAVWAENYCEMKPATSGDAPSVGDAVSMQSGAFGGTMSVLAATGGLAYNKSYNLQSGGGYTATLNVVLNDYLKPGSIILLTLHALSSGLVRGYDLYSLDGNDKVATLTTTEGNSTTLQYTVVADDKLEGTNGFRLVKANTNLIYLKSLAVTDCQPGGVISASGWNTYSSNKKLDLSTISGGTAYVASSTRDGRVQMDRCTDIVAAEEGLLIHGTPGEKFTINATTDAVTYEGTNLLVGVPNGGEAPVGSYVFGWPTADPTSYGFYYVNSSAVALGAGKSYLSTGGGGGARLTLIFDEDETSGISTTVNNQEPTCCFDLQGRKVVSPTKGLYIKNGKKVFVGQKR
jgi:uncharacterized repeat protein (TIGR02543 family)